MRKKSQQKDRTASTSIALIVMLSMRLFPRRISITVIRIVMCKQMRLHAPREEEMESDLLTIGY